MLYGSVRPLAFIKVRFFSGWLHLKGEDIYLLASSFKKKKYRGTVPFLVYSLPFPSHAWWVPRKIYNQCISLMAGYLQSLVFAFSPNPAHSFPCSLSLSLSLSFSLPHTYKKVVLACSFYSCHSGEKRAFILKRRTYATLKRLRTPSQGQCF